MNLNARLRFVALTSLAVPMALFFASYYALRTSTLAIETQYRDEMVPATMLAHIDSLIKNTRSHVLGGYMHNPANELSKLHDHPLDLHVNFLTKAHRDIEQKWAAYTALPPRKDEAELVRVADYGIKLYLKQTLAPAEQALRTSRYDDVIRSTTNSFKAIGATEKALSELQERAAKRAEATVAAARQREHSILLLSLGLTVFGAAVAAMVLLSIWRSMLRSIRVIGTIAHNLKSHKLTLVRAPEANDELGMICADLASATQSLRASVRDVLRVSDQVAHAAGEISAGNHDLSNRTESQASTLQETASSMQVLTSSAQQNSNDAREASGMVASTAESARRGGELVEGVLRTMDEIKDSSRRAVEIIGLIDGIAFQTNILALNAAVEAARAGSEGWGFSVVAGEVRSLAQRAASAARDIKALIGETVERVETGGRIVADAGRGMREIVISVERAEAFMTKISGASEAQSCGIGQVNTAVGEMDLITQQNAALVEQTSAAAENLKQQASILRNALAEFEIQGADELESVTL